MSTNRSRVSTRRGRSGAGTDGTLPTVEVIGIDEAMNQSGMLDEDEEELLMAEGFEKKVFEKFITFSFICYSFFNTDQKY